MARTPPAEPFRPGAMVPLEGAEIRLVADAAAPRSGLRVGGELRFGGPINGFARRVERFLRARALALLAEEVAEFCAVAGLSARAVTIGDAATRWGSCGADGRIRLSWRLILASPSARRFVVAHEVAHLRHLNHGARFKALEAELVGPGMAEAKAALKREGPRLRRIGRG